MSRPTASPNHWPYLEHRTLAEIQADMVAEDRRHDRVVELLARGRFRPLRASEQRELSDLIEAGRVV